MVGFFVVIVEFCECEDGVFVCRGVEGFGGFFLCFLGDIEVGL